MEPPTPHLRVTGADPEAAHQQLGGFFQHVPHLALPFLHQLLVCLTIDLLFTAEAKGMVQVSTSARSEEWPVLTSELVSASLLRQTLFKN